MKQLEPDLRAHAEHVSELDVEECEGLEEASVLERTGVHRIEPDLARKLPEIPGSGLSEVVVKSYRIVYRRKPHTVEVLTVFEGDRLLRRGELPEDV